jgi:hypothetical protein
MTSRDSTGPTAEDLSRRNSNSHNRFLRGPRSISSNNPRLSSNSHRVKS